MRLKRLKLENWRGVEARELEFSDGVTLIEGPNESGKSTLVEALHTLIREFDSSTKQAIKAVQPVGRDVGSAVEAEIETGDWRFVYSKTYNREKQTSLNILAPKKEQLTGREAHERAGRILDETVDLALWEALLVDQGEKIAPVDIRDSVSLSRALDAAAGAGSIGAEDTDLFDAAQSEYETYFTPGRGSPRFTPAEKAVDSAREKLAAATAALEEVEQYADRQQRLADDVRAREKKQPELTASAEQYEKERREIDALRSDVKVREKELDAARKAAEEARRAADEREALVRSIDEAGKAIRDLDAALAPKREAIATLERHAASAEQVLKDLKQKRGRARKAMSLAQSDARHLRQKDQLAAIRRTVRQLETVTANIERCASNVAKIAVDEPGLKRIRDSEHDLRVLESRRDVAATRITIRADKDLTVGIGSDDLTLAAAESLQRQLASVATIRFPGVASVTVEPPDAAADLESQVSEAGASLDALYRQYAVSSAEDAAIRLAKKLAAQNELTEARRREAELLAERSRPELDETARTLGDDVATYEKERGSDAPLPSSTEAAEAAESAAQADFHAFERKIQDAEERAQSIRGELGDVTAAMRELDHELIRQRSTLEERQERLAQQRARTDDTALGQRVQAAHAALEDATRNRDAAQSRLDELNPERIQSLAEASRAAVERGQSELDQARNELANLTGRLEQSQASGRFEQKEEAERDLDHAESTYANIKRRADAAKRLFECLSEHRNAARQAYVEPLKTAIEGLGRIVFGNDFEIALGDDWTIESLTRSGTTLPYDALSVGAKEQLGILTRLAAARIVAKEGGVPLIIDDALGFSDPARLQSMAAAISSAAKECQVIILTCAPDRFAGIGAASLIRF